MWKLINIKKPLMYKNKKNKIWQISFKKESKIFKNNQKN